MTHMRLLKAQAVWPPRAGKAADPVTLNQPAPTTAGRVAVGVGVPAAGEEGEAGVAGGARFFPQARGQQAQRINSSPGIFFFMSSLLLN